MFVLSAMLVASLVPMNGVAVNVYLHIIYQALGALPVQLGVQNVTRRPGVQNVHKATL